MPVAKQQVEEALIKEAIDEATKERPPVDPEVIAEKVAKKAAQTAIKVRLENEAAIKPTEYMNPAVWSQMKAMASVFITSKAIPSYLANVNQVMVVLQAGIEMGLKPIEALNDLYIVNGSVNLWGKGLVKAFRRHGYDLEFEDEKDEATAIVKKNGKVVAKETYTFEEAQKSGYTKDRYGNLKVGWKPGLNRRLKLRYGALAIIAKTVLPEILGSINGVAEMQIDATNDESPVANNANAGHVKPTTTGGSSLKDFLLNKSKKTIHPIQEGEVVADKPKPKPKKKTDVVKKADKPKEESTKTEVKPQHDETWQRAKRAYFAELKKAQLNHEDVKELEGFKSLNDLTIDEIKALTDKIKD